MPSPSKIYAKLVMKRIPLENDSLQGYRVHPVPLTSLKQRSLKDIEGMSNKDKDRSQNFFALGITFWIFDRPLGRHLNLLD